MTSTNTSASARIDEPRDMWRLHILDTSTREMIIVDCRREDITMTRRSFDPLRYQLRYIEDASPAVPLTGIYY